MSTLRFTSQFHSEPDWRKGYEKQFWAKGFLGFGMPGAGEGRAGMRTGATLGRRNQYIRDSMRDECSIREERGRRLAKVVQRCMDSAHRIGAQGRTGTRRMRLYRDTLTMVGWEVVWYV